MPLVSLTRATLRNAEFGFFGVCVYTRVQTPRFCGQDCRAGLAVLYFGAVRPLRTSWLNVGTLCSSFVLPASFYAGSRLKRHGKTFGGNHGRSFAHVPLAAHWALIGAQDSSQRLGLGSLCAWPLRAALPMLPLTQHPGEYRFPIRLGVRRWRRGRSASQPESRCGDRERGHSVSLPRPAYPLESSSGSADTFQRGHPTNTILQDRDQCSTARHYRQAKYDSQNPFNIASRELSVNQESLPIQDEPGAGGMLRIDNQRARSREAEPGADRGFSKSQRRHPVRRRKSPAGLRLGGAGSAPTAIPETRPPGARLVAALSGEDDRPEPGPGDAPDRPLSGPRRCPARPLPAASLSATLYPRRRGAAGHRR